MQWKSDLSALRHRMVAKQILERGIRNPAILNAMEEIPRHQFVPYTPAKKAYGDGPLPIGQGQTISQPYIVAYMTEILELHPSHKVLEVGTGSGYQTALLAHLVAEVYSIEIVVSHYIRARKVLSKYALHNIHLRLGNGREGWSEEAPFDRIIVTAASTKAPENLLDQLREGGLMIIPVGPTPFEQKLKIFRKKNGIIARRDDLPVRFVPLIDQSA